ncbi:hypothetical protein K9U39_03050 [Rhodoblastus acidophilus]|jgi:hypothetical protein|uniref:Uncharacterized protein n=1 Tax=Candidatus Rhodoblastus alkanivorans TaxID=2954117 RepID=A0ABS9Z7H7_9HYPH|nr:hypothetical protein [Candidatus Rhodoblastus alkanivorans]MCI4677641.1 hypothetical protein [Candidatus Rhodoblastus alkanivorans]MCI4682627.1 hypothetical protein [Candidatus Rhodoblastus alkanivorans]MDI4639933.1 hypothetical protein [Rhodoblastus acidophilus]
MAVKNEKPGDIAARVAGNPRRASGQRRADGFKRESFVLPREKAREKAREIFASFPKAAYMTEIESWRELADGQIEFTMRRLPSAD